MNLGGKQDLDSLLRDWPAPAPGKGPGRIESDDDPIWDERAAAVVRAATKPGAATLASEAIDALLAAPALPPEPGESGGSASIVAVGEKKMSQEKEPGDSPASIPAPATERKRTSLKAIAERASQSGARQSLPPASTPPPAKATPIPRSVPSRPVEAAKDDSGVINLNAVNESATAQEKAAAEKAKPASTGLFEDEAPAAKRAPAVAGKAVAPAAKKGSNGPVIGLAIGVLGIAAAFALVQMNKKPAAPPAPVVAENKPAKPEAKPAPSPEAKPTAAPAATALSAAELPTADPAATAEPGKVAAANPGATGGVAPSATAGAKDPPKDGKVAANAPPSGKPGDLESEMRKAVGKNGGADKGAGADIPPVAPAAGDARNQNVPEQPAMGAVQAAMGAVMGGAKACVAGAEEVSRATVTFSSNGTVSNVSVTGWAVSNGAAGCIKSALKAAKVGPFSKPSFSVPVTIRP